MRVPSAKPAPNGGYFHAIDGAAPRNLPPVEPDKPHDPSWLRGHYARCRDRTRAEQVLALARSLGLVQLALSELGPAWDGRRTRWLFPMYDAAGEIIGLRTREADGLKRSVKGSRNGLFLPRSQPIWSDRLFICEGPTDTAAILGLAFCAIGRPSCLGSADAVCEYVKRGGYTQAIIVADNDTPGWRGASALLRRLPIEGFVFCPPAKDAREWIAAGATRGQVDRMLEQRIGHRGPTPLATSDDESKSRAKTAREDAQAVPAAKRRTAGQVQKMAQDSNAGSAAEQPATAPR